MLDMLIFDIYSLGLCFPADFVRAKPKSKARAPKGFVHIAVTSEGEVFGKRSGQAECLKTNASSGKHYPNYKKEVGYASAYNSKVEARK